METQRGLQKTGTTFLLAVGKNNPPSTTQAPKAGTQGRAKPWQKQTPVREKKEIPATSGCEALPEVR